jgi:transcriptional regulator
MYVPASFRKERLSEMHALMLEHPLALRVSHGDEGLVASPVPFLLYPEEGERGTLRAHVARANPHWKALASAAECLVVFQGEQGYVTPSWYATKRTTHKVVPTWNYETVPAWGAPAVRDDAGWLSRQLRDLTTLKEKRRPQPWAVDDARPDFVAMQMRAIVGIEIPIARIEGKWKMSQNRDEADRRRVVEGLRDAGDPHRNARVAEFVERRTRG